MAANRRVPCHRRGDPGRTKGSLDDVVIGDQLDRRYHDGGHDPVLHEPGPTRPDHHTDEDRQRGGPGGGAPYRAGRRLPGVDISALDRGRTIDVVARRPPLRRAHPPATRKDEKAREYHHRADGDGCDPDVVTGLLERDDRQRNEYRVDRERNDKREHPTRQEKPRAEPIPRPLNEAVHNRRLSALYLRCGRSDTSRSERVPVQLSQRVNLLERVVDEPGRQRGGAGRRDGVQRILGHRRFPHRVQ